MANRVTFLVDGLNLYFSVLEAENGPGTFRLRWLNVDSLLRSYLSVFGPDAILEDLHLFTAIPSFRQQHDPRGVRAHEKHLQALRETGVHLHIADFKRKTLTCPQCRDEIDRYEEKETDVALGVKAMELLYLNACDTLVIVSGDTDFAPAMRTAKRLFPAVQVCVAFPHARFNAELQQIADFSFRIRYRCFKLLGLSGTVISSQPASSSGLTTRSLNLVLTWSRLGPDLVPPCPKSSGRPPRTAAGHKPPEIIEVHRIPSWSKAGLSLQCANSRA